MAQAICVPEKTFCWKDDSNFNWEIRKILKNRTFHQKLHFLLKIIFYLFAYKIYVFHNG